MKRFLLPLAAALAVGCALHAHAFSYQGALADLAGNPMQGPQKVEFRLYGDATGGSPLWGRTCNVLLDEKGVFNTEIADDSGTAPADAPAGVSLDAVLADYAKIGLYLGLTVVGSAGEIAPRLRLLPVPYAVFAHNVAAASGDFAAAGKVTAATLDVSGDASFSAAATFSGNAAVEGDLTVSGALSGYGSVPVGTIVLWSGSTDDIPDGWTLCNGQNGTPDLRNRFVVGAGGSYSVNNTGGKDSFYLTPSQLPPHHHLYSGDDQLTFVKPGNTGYSAANNVEETTSGYDAVSSTSGNARIYRTSSVGSSSSIDNRPSYYALCYIMRIK